MLWVLGGFCFLMGMLSPKMCFLPWKIDCKAKRGLIVAKKPHKAPASHVWEGIGKLIPASRAWEWDRRAQRDPSGSNRGFCSLITYESISDTSGKSPVNVSLGWEDCPHASPHRWVRAGL